MFVAKIFDFEHVTDTGAASKESSTDARKPSKSIFTKSDPTRIQTRKASNGCTKSLKSHFPTRARSEPFAEAREGQTGSSAHPKTDRIAQ